MKFKTGDLVRLNSREGESRDVWPGHNSACVYTQSGEEHHIKNLSRSMVYKVVEYANIGENLKLKPMSKEYFINTDPILYEGLDVDEYEEYCVTSYVEPDALLPAALLKREEYVK